MPIENELSPIETKLTIREQKALQYWQNSQEAPLSPILQAELFSLYLQGYNCEHIRKLNPQYSLGQIVQSKVSGKWDDLVEEMRTELLEKISAKHQQATLQTVNLVADMLAAANKKYGEAIQKYIQNNDESGLGDMQIKSLPALQKAVEILQKLTGQDNKKQIVGDVNVHHTLSPIAEKPIATDEAAILVAKFLEEKK